MVIVRIAISMLEICGINDKKCLAFIERIVSVNVTY